MGKVALCMIVKGSDDEAEHLKRCLENVSKHVDGIYLNVNHKEGESVSQSVLDVARAHTDNIIETVWEDDFAKARNACLDTIPLEYEWVLWLDTDDTVDKPKKIKEVIEESNNFDSIFVDYLYDQDEEGNPLTVHLVARMFKNNGSHRWKGSIHETLIETRGVTQGATKDFMVVHHADDERKNQSFERNIKMLEAQLEAEAKDPDPRTFYYLASTYMDAGAMESAKMIFLDYLKLSGWDQERSAANNKLGQIYFEEGDRASAKQHLMMSIGEDPDNPEPRVAMGSLELDMKQYGKAVHWLTSVEKMKKDLTTLERNPMSYTFRTYLLLAEAYLSMGGNNLENAAKYAKKARKYKKNDQNVQAYCDMVENVERDKTELERYVSKFKRLKDKGQKAKAQKVLDSIPEHLADNVVVAALRKENKSFKWPKKSIAIMTGDTALDAWGPWSLKEGIGGSEEAVIRLSRQLTKQGWKVVVFAKPGIDTGLDEHGVMWRNYWDCNLDDEFDIFVAWRAPFIFDKKIKARKSYLWLHDVMEEGEFTPERIANFTKCILLSKYHRSLFPMIPEEKVLMSGNGIDPEEFEAYDGKLERDPHKILYASSHVRGLAYLYEIWPEVKRAVPDATLDVYYGRQSYDAVHKGNPERMKWMDDMMAKAEKLDGVIDHGKADQEEIVREGFRSGLWAYPCPFPEIYCITAIKSQASGAVPVSSTTAALNETVQFGHKQEFGEFDDADLEKYKESLIWWLQHPEEQEKVRPAMMSWARTQSWEGVAKQWSTEFQS